MNFFSLCFRKLFFIHPKMNLSNISQQIITFKLIIFRKAIYLFRCIGSLIICGGKSYNFICTIEIIYEKSLWNNQCLYFPFEYKNEKQSHFKQTHNEIGFVYSVFIVKLTVLTVYRCIDPPLDGHHLNADII